MNPMGLPLNWQMVKFEEVATFTKKPRSLRYSDYNEIPFVPMNLIPIATLFSKEFILKPSDTLSSGTYFEPGDILLAKITPSFENGKQCIIKELPMPFGIATTEVIPIREVEGVSDKFYLFYYLLLPDVRALLTERMQGTTGRLRLGPKTLAELEIPLPPLAEQKRIVAKIETLFTQLDAAVDSLKKAHAQLQRYRRSILKAAFEGELTREWREGHSGELEPMTVSEVSMQEGLPDLPDGWVWTEIKDTAEFIRGVSYRKNQSSKTPKTDYVPILRANNINGQLNYEDLIYVPLEKVKDEQFVKTLDIIIAMSSGSKHLVGKAAQAHQDFEGGFGTFCGLVRVSEEVNQKFIGLFFQSPIYRNEISRLSIGININNLRSANIEAMLIPLPPLTEQEQIVSELERCLSIADEVEARIASELVRAERLRQSILKQAFSGKLVPQDPNDEPASVLLERMQDEKKCQQPKRRKKTTKSKSQEIDDYPLLTLAGALEQNGDSIDAASLVELRGGKGE